ncbi:hypothetical protein RM545_03810 [Zunongwangia sp. F260]|uniref:PEGA domain-containing protein n=1 Tax=Autumnicola lenta TaxID=3075593 RepID=A0ABU3CHH9_9FLAO|nr:hypothetical protein [Zunongwangia sp. F260]MDT0645803.1 hypothetical protein [Zunongwangia sp. F260]
MKKITFLILFALTFSLLPTTSAHAHTEADYYGKKKVKVGVSETDAEIYVNGKLLGKGSTEVLVPKNSCVTVVTKKTGFLNETIEFCNQKGMTKPPRTHYVKMRNDDAFDASVQTDIANVDIEIKVNAMDKNQAWKLINQIVLNYIDVIEMTDKETGYLRTAWSLQTFEQNTIRTRMIVKESSTNPLRFKVKLVSEESGDSMTSVKSDHLYKEWDRVLRSYNNVISEFQARIK